MPSQPSPMTTMTTPLSDPSPAPPVVGYWVPTAVEMPDDEITVLVWLSHQDDATLAHHDTEVLQRRGDTGWIMAGSSRVLPGVTHWCREIFPPNAEVRHGGLDDTETN